MFGGKGRRGIGDIQVERTGASHLEELGMVAAEVAFAGESEKRKVASVERCTSRLMPLV